MILRFYYFPWQPEKLQQHQSCLLLPAFGQTAICKTKVKTSNQMDESEEKFKKRGARGRGEAGSPSPLPPASGQGSRQGNRQANKQAAPRLLAAHHGFKAGADRISQQPGMHRASAQRGEEMALIRQRVNSQV